MRRLLVLAASAVLPLLTSCAPVRADHFVVAYAGQLATNQQPPSSGEAIITVRNLSRERIAPLLVRVHDSTATAELDASDWTTVNRFDRLGPQRAGRVGFAPVVDEDTAHVHLGPGRYLLLADAAAPLSPGRLLEFYVG